MIRVVKNEGMILWYDYHVNNPWNPDVRGVKKQEILRLFPSCQIRVQRTTLAPPLFACRAPIHGWRPIVFQKYPVLHVLSSTDSKD